jgi:hypothetical protein
LDTSITTMMGFLRRPTPGEIEEEGSRFIRPCGLGALSRAISENQFAAPPPFRIQRSESFTCSRIELGLEAKGATVRHEKVVEVLN